MITGEVGKEMITQKMRDSVKRENELYLACKTSRKVIRCSIMLAIDIREKGRKAEF